MILVTHVDAAAGGGVGVGTANPDTKNAYTINGLVINNPADSAQDTYELVTVALTDQFRVNTEPLPDRDGLQPYHPAKTRKIIKMDGIIRAPTMAKLNYKVMQLHRYTDPVNMFWDDSTSFLTTAGSDKGFLPMTFNAPTTDTANYASGLIPCVVYVRCIKRAVQVTSKLEGYGARFDLLFELADPRIYHNVTQSVVLNNGSSTAHTSVTEYPTWPLLTIVLSGAGGAVNSISRLSPVDENNAVPIVTLDFTKTLLGAAGGAGDSITLYMKNGRVLRSGVERPDYLVAGAMGFWPVLPGALSFLFSGTNITSATLSYSRAFS